MKNFKNIEVFNIETRADGLWAWISFQKIDGRDEMDLNDGYGHICVPIKPRVIQKSIRDNILVNQSEQNDVDCVTVNEDRSLNETNNLKHFIP